MKRFPSADVIPLLLLIAALLGAGVLGWAALRAHGIGLDALLGLTAADVESFARAWGGWSAAAAILLMVLHSFVPLPAEVIALANGMMFGPVWGVAVTWVGAMLGALLAFALARRLGRPAVRRLVPERHWRAIEGWQGRPATLLLLRLIPVISFNIINYAAGLAGVGWWSFAWTTALGILPLTIVSVVLGDTMLGASWQAWLLVGIGLVLLWLAWRRFAPRLSGARRRPSPPPR
jgi:uncharacterized membrane protein YdjX (TVP38/TMEM64 family)